MEWEKMRQVAMIFTTTVLSGLVLIGLMFFVALPVLEPVLVAIARCHRRSARSPLLGGLVFGWIGVWIAAGFRRTTG
jgi:hypothetical protein